MAPSLSQISNKSTGDGGTGLGIANGVSTGGTEMIRGASGMGMMGISPNLGMSLMGGFGSPAGLAGLDIGTPGLLGAAAVGGQPMGLSLSDLGVSSKRNEDEDRRNKLEGVLGRLLGKRKRTNGDYSTSGMGRVCDEGVRRTGRWAGFDVEVEAKYEGKEFEGERPIIVAGRSAVLIDVSFKNNLPKSIEVSFSSEQEQVSAHQKPAADVLMGNLTPKPGMAAINTKLDQFAANLEALSRLDRFSTPQLNCVEAVTGVYTSLKRLYDHEKEAAQALFDSKIKNQEEKIEDEVICKKSGRPGMHTHGRIGLSLDYWKETASPNTRSTSTIKSELDENMETENNNTNAQNSSTGIYALELTVEPNDASAYPALRNSLSWISERIIKPQEESSDPVDILSTKPLIDWLDPEPTLIKAETDHDTMDIDGSTNRKSPAARFVARLHPPLVLPYTTAMQILQSVDLTTMPPPSPESYDSMLLGTQPPTLDGTQHPVTCTKKVLIRTHTGDKDVNHNYTLYVPRPEYAFKLEEIPFSHPRQIIALLPVLRQWACVGALLKSSFSTPSKSSQTSNLGTASTSTKNLDASSLFDAPSASPRNTLNSNGLESEETNIDITLSTTLPNPSLNIIFPLHESTADDESATNPGTIIHSRSIASINVEILPDAEIMVSDQDVFESKQEDRRMKDDDESSAGLPTGSEIQQRTIKLGKGLAVAGDIGVWIEWVRQQARSTAQ